jgi:hypothetical protein
MKAFLVGWLNYLAVRECAWLCQRMADDREAEAQAADAEACKWRERGALFGRIRNAAQAQLTAEHPELFADAGGGIEEVDGPLVDCSDAPRIASVLRGPRPFRRGRGAVGGHPK